MLREYRGSESSRAKARLAKRDCILEHMMCCTGINLAVQALLLALSPRGWLPLGLAGFGALTCFILSAANHLFWPQFRSYTMAMVVTFLWLLVLALCALDWGMDGIGISWKRAALFAALGAAQLLRLLVVWRKRFSRQILRTSF